MCGAEGVCGWRGGRCTWPALMVVGDIALPKGIDEELDQTWSESLIGDGDSGGSSGGGGSGGGGSGNGGSGGGSGSGGSGSVVENGIGEDCFGGCWRCE